MSAFGAEEGPVILTLVNELLDDSTALPLLSLVAEEGRRVIGHILFTAVGLPTADRDISARILAPLAVSGEHQRGGVGGGLVREGLRRLTDEGVDLVFVLGHPDYYPRFGFRPAGALGLDAPYSIPPEKAAAWMVMELHPGIVGTVRGVIRCAATLHQPQHWRE
jgi:putative acetyltransferase